MVLSEVKDRIEEELTDEEIINYRIRKTTRQIEDELSKNRDAQDRNNESKKMDPYFDSIKKWRPL